MARAKRPNAFSVNDVSMMDNRYQRGLKTKRPTKKDPSTAILDGPANRKPHTTQRQDNGKRLADDDTFVGVLSPCVKRTLFEVNRQHVIRLTFRLHHEPMGPKRRRSVEKNLATFKARCDRYGKVTVDGRERLMRPFKAE